MKKTLIHVVMGSTGEYSDHTYWAVCAFFSEEKAKTHVELLTREGNIVKEKREKIDDYCEREKILPPHDKKFKLDYCGFNYWIETVEAK